MFAKRNKVQIKVGDGELPRNESKESLVDAVKVTAFWRQMSVFRRQEIRALGVTVTDCCFSFFYMKLYSLLLYGLFVPAVKRKQTHPCISMQAVC